MIVCTAGERLQANNLFVQFGTLFYAKSLRRFGLSRRESSDGVGKKSSRRDTRGCSH